MAEYQVPYPRSRPGLAALNKQLSFTVHASGKNTLINIADHAVTPHTEAAADVLDTVASDCGQVRVQRMECNNGMLYRSTSSAEAPKCIQYPYRYTGFITGVAHTPPTDVSHGKTILKLAGFDRQEFAYWTTFTSDESLLNAKVTAMFANRPLHKGRDFYSATILYIAIQVRLNDSDGGQVPVFCSIGSNMKKPLVGVFEPTPADTAPAHAAKLSTREAIIRSENEAGLIESDVYKLFSDDVQKYHAKVQLNANNLSPQLGSQLHQGGSQLQLGSQSVQYPGSPALAPHALGAPFGTPSIRPSFGVATNEIANGSTFSLAIFTMLEALGDGKQLVKRVWMTGVAGKLFTSVKHAAGVTLPLNYPCIARYTADEDTMSIDAVYDVKRFVAANDVPEFPPHSVRASLWKTWGEPPASSDHRRSLVDIISSRPDSGEDGPLLPVVGLTLGHDCRSSGFRKSKKYVFLVWKATPDSAHYTVVGTPENESAQYMWPEGEGPEDPPEKTHRAEPEQTGLCAWGWGTAVGASVVELAGLRFTNDAVLQCYVLGDSLTEPLACDTKNV